MKTHFTPSRVILNRTRIIAILAVLVFGFSQNVYGLKMTLGSNTPIGQNLCAGSSKMLIQSFSVTIGGGGGGISITGVTNLLGGTFTSADAVDFQLWYSGTANNFAAASQIGSSFGPANAGDLLSFTFASPAFASGSTYYFWITVDIASAGAGNPTISSGAMTNANITTDMSLGAGTVNAGPTQTVYYRPGCPVLTAPADGSSLACGVNSTTLKWNSAACFTSYKVYLDQNNPPTTLVSNQLGTSYATGALSLSTTYYWRVVPTNFLGDATGCSVYSFTTGSDQSAPIAADQSRCDPGTLTLTASGGGMPNYVWFDAAAGGNAIGFGSSYTTPSLSATTPYWVMDLAPGTENTLNTATTYTSYCGGTNNSALLFNYTNNSATNPLIITKLAVGGYFASGTYSAQVYYRSGTYVGNETSSTGWVNVFNGTFTDNATHKVLLDVTDFAIAPSGVSGIYVFFTAEPGLFLNTANTYSDANLTVTAGSVVCSPTAPFTGGSLSANRSPFGYVNYKTTSCLSPRTQVNAIITGVLSTGGTVTVNPGSTITPCLNTTFTCVPINGGTDPTYQWQLNGINIPGENASTYSSMTLNTGDQISCIVTSNDPCVSPSSASSNIISMTVSGASPVITTQPVGVSVCQNGSTSFTVAATPDGPYQWMVSEDGGLTWSPITEAGSSPVYSGWTTKTLGLTTITGDNDGFQYLCMAGCNSSNIATLTVEPHGFPTAINGGSCTTPAKITLGASGADANENYHWYNDLTGGSLLGTGSSYTTPNIFFTTTYYVTLYNTTSGCESYPRTPVVAEIYAAPTVTSQPSDQTINVGGSTNFSVTASGALSYQWQLSTDGGAFWTDILAAGSSPTYAGWNTSNLSLYGCVLANNGNMYRCKISGNCTYVTFSNAALLTVLNLPVIYLHPTVGLQSTFAGNCMENTCTGTYYDDGGSSATYGNNINNIFRTFCPNSPQMAVRATINMLDVEYAGAVCNDALYIQNGPGQSSPVLWGGCGTTAPLSIVTTSGAYGGGVFTSSHVSGCLTFRFNSGASSAGGPWDGWQITLDCVSFPSGPTGETNADCVNATPICSDVTASSYTYGPGLTSDACSGCVTTEFWTEWYYVHIATSGTVELEIVPNGVSDLDFAFFRTDNCASMGDPVRCSYAARTSPGKTGMRDAPGTLDYSEDVSGDQWVQEISVTAGEYYYLMVNEWDKPNPNQYTLDWTLTDGASFNCDITEPLPISLIALYAERIDDVVEVTWVTATETNNDYFTVEKSVDGVEFSAMGTVEGAGNSNMIHSYQFNDPDPLDVIAYYRIKQTDFNGAYTYSKIVTVDPNKDSETPITVSVFPNPSSEFITVQGSRYFVNKPYKIYNLFGALISEGTLNGVSQRISLQDLPDGVYMLDIEKVTSARFSVIH